MIRLGLCLLLFTFSLSTSADQGGACHTETFKKGLLWEISGPGLEPSYLFGTIHLQDSRITSLPSIVEQSLKSSRQYVMEVELHPLAVTAYQERSQLDTDTGLDQLLDKEAFSQLNRLVTDHYGVQTSVLRRLKPWAVFLMLGRPPNTGGKILDQVLAERAEQNNLDISGLETMDELLDELESMTLRDQLAILVDSIDNYKQIERQIEQLKEKYLQQDLAGMDALNREEHDDELLFERFMEHLLYRRNARMLKRMQPLIDNGRVFIAVGALHLTGHRGLLCGLKSAGYSLKPLY